MLEKEYALEIQKRIDTAAQLIRDAADLSEKHAHSALADLHCYDDEDEELTDTNAIIRALGYAGWHTSSMGC